MHLASKATGLPPEQFGVVARLFVSPSVRRGGVGQSLLRAAARHATNEGLTPILDVATQFEGAIHLYERCGWVRAGMVTVRLSETVDLDEFVYLVPCQATFALFGSVDSDPAVRGTRPTLACC
jgi:ribosomal protein S18 acetylase RimI-like enzyme